MKKLVEIDQAIGEVEATLTKLEGDKSKNLSLLETAKQARERGAFQALASDDAEGRKALAKARGQQREAELSLEDADFAIAEAHRQLEVLKGERAEAFKHDRWQEFQKVSERSLAEAQVLSGVVMGMGQLILEHDKTLRELTILANESGHPTTSFRLAHFRRFLDAGLHKILPHEFSNQPGIYRSGDYQEFLSEQIDATGNRAEVEPKAQQTA